MGEGSDGKVVDPRAGDLGGHRQGQAARGLQTRTSRGDTDRLTHVVHGEVVEQDEISAGLEDLRELGERVDLDLDVDARELAPHRVERRSNTARSNHVVVLDQCSVR